MNETRAVRLCWLPHKRGRHIHAHRTVEMKMNAWCRINSDTLFTFLSSWPMLCVFLVFSKACANTYSYEFMSRHELAQSLAVCSLIHVYACTQTASTALRIWLTGANAAFSVRFSSRCRLLCSGFDSLPWWQYDLVDSLTCDWIDVIKFIGTLNVADSRP